jgi:polyvinyl alcohol dehydrogenase (cytochrome)
MRHVIVSAVVALALPAGALAQSAAPDGEAIYRQHCAGCHNGTMPRMPSRDALKRLTPEHVETALSSFSMRRQGAALTLPERRAVAEYVTGSASGSYRAPLEVIPKSAYCAAPSTSSDLLAGAAWNGFGGDARNSRFAPAAAAGLAPTAVPRLKLKWAFGFPGVSASGSQVTVAGNRAFVGSRNGVVYALDTKSGCIAWAFEADAGVRSTPVVGGTGAARALYFGDANAQAYSLDIATGKLRWKVKVETHQDAIVTGAVAFANGRVYVPVSSMEEDRGHSELRMLHVPGQRERARRGDRHSDLEDLHRQRDAAKDDEDRSRHAAVGSVGRRGLVDASARSGAQPDVHRDG